MPRLQSAALRRSLTCCPTNLSDPNQFFSSSLRSQSDSAKILTFVSFTILSPEFSLKFRPIIFFPTCHPPPPIWKQMQTFKRACIRAMQHFYNFTILHFLNFGQIYNFQASLNHRANSCSFSLLGWHRFINTLIFNYELRGSSNWPVNAN
jgi:hypothetical protein